MAVLTLKQIEQLLDKKLKNFATKDDLKRVESRLGGVESRLGGVESELGGVKEELKIVNRKIDILQKTTPNRIEFNDHEKRIGRLEKTVFVTP